MTAKQFVLQMYPLAVYLKHLICCGRVGKPQYKYCIYINLEQAVKEQPFVTSGTVTQCWQSAKSKIEEMERVK